MGGQWAGGFVRRNFPDNDQDTQKMEWHLIEPFVASTHIGHVLHRDDIPRFEPSAGMLRRRVAGRSAYLSAVVVTLKCSHLSNTSL